MVTTYEIASRFLAELEEAWHDEVFVAFNAIMNPKGAKDEIQEFTRAVRRLVESDLLILGTRVVSKGIWTELDKEESLALVEKLDEMGEFDHETGRWRVKTNDYFNCEHPVAYLTEAGLGAARELLMERGYRWWG